MRTHWHICKHVRSLLKQYIAPNTDPSVLFRTLSTLKCCVSGSLQSASNDWEGEVGVREPRFRVAIQ